MGRWVEVFRCKECGKIFKDKIPSLCPKCGEHLCRSDGFMLLIWGGRLRDPNKCEKVVARRRIFGWQIRQPEQTATQNKQASGNDLQQDTEGTV